MAKKSKGGKKAKAKNNQQKEKVESEIVPEDNDATFVVGDSGDEDEIISQKDNNLNGNDIENDNSIEDENIESQVDELSSDKEEEQEDSNVNETPVSLDEHEINILESTQNLSPEISGIADELTEKKNEEEDNEDNEGTHITTLKDDNQGLLTKNETSQENSEDDKTEEVLKVSSDHESTKDEIEEEENLNQNVEPVVEVTDPVIENDTETHVEEYTKNNNESIEDTKEILSEKSTEDHNQKESFSNESAEKDNEILSEDPVNEEVEEPETTRNEENEIKELESTEETELEVNEEPSSMSRTSSEKADSIISFKHDENTIISYNETEDQINEKISLNEPTPLTNEELKILQSKFIYGLAVVNFDHIKGPELTYWLDDDIIKVNEDDEQKENKVIDEKIDKYSKIWPYLAFQALPDGVHMFDETFTQFTLSYDEKYQRETNDEGEMTTLFGCACIRQIDSSLIKPDEDVKRSVVQKSIILITRCPIPIQLREKLSIICKSWFEQYDFDDVSILKLFYQDISRNYNENGFIIQNDELFGQTNVESSKKIIKEGEILMGFNFQDIVIKLRRNLLVLFKLLIMGNKRILIFSKDLNLLSNTQYVLIGLIANLIVQLERSGYPKSKENERVKSQSLKSSDRSSVLKFLGLPLNIFGNGSFFQPYLTLQQLTYLDKEGVESFLVGSSNDIILERKNEWFDAVLYLDEKDNSLLNSIGFLNLGCKLEIVNKSLKDKLTLSWDDKKFIDYIIDSVEKHKLENKDHVEIPESKTINSNSSIDNGNYKGGDDFIRSLFEDYLIGFLSSIKYDEFLKNEHERGFDQINENLKLDLFENCIGKFNIKYVETFKESKVFKEWNSITEDELFNFFEPRHIHGDEKLKKEEVEDPITSKQLEEDKPEEEAKKESPKEDTVEIELPKEGDNEEPPVKERKDEKILNDIKWFFKKGEDGGAEKIRSLFSWK